jgi:hypothetical protein
MANEFNQNPQRQRFVGSISVMTNLHIATKRTSVLETDKRRLDDFGFQHLDKHNDMLVFAKLQIN